MKFQQPVGQTDPEARNITFRLSSVMCDFPHKRQQGVRCPFYGFAWPAATSRLQHVDGNQCGLALDQVESCAMEEAGLEVDIEMCPTALRLSQFVRLAAPVIAFVVPDHPEGLSYAEWRRREKLEPPNDQSPEAEHTHASASDQNSF